MTHERRVADGCAGRQVSGAVLATLVLVLVAGAISPAAAQIVEATGSRALGMGGAFVAVANDASATWWNPAGLADAPFFNLTLERAVTDSSEQFPAQRDRVSTFAIGTVFGGFSYYRLRLTEIRDSDPTGGALDGREEDQGNIPVRSLAVSQYGLSRMQTLVPGTHAGVTVKYLRGTPRTALVPAAEAPDELLGRGEDLEGGGTDHEFDVDIGLIAAYGPVKVGAVMRNVFEPEFGDGADARQLQRQTRLGVAFDGDRADMLPVTASLDVDLRRYHTLSGERRVAALGLEGWLFGKRLGLRAGGRFNTVGAKDRATTAGVSVALRQGVFIDWHLVRGGATEDRGWGLAARVSI